MFLSWLASWKRPRVAARAPQSRRRLEIESLERRDVPSLAPWTSYNPNQGDLVDRLIRQLAPGTHDSITFFRDLNGWLSTSIAPRVPHAETADQYLAELHGDCTVRAHIFQTVAQRLGIQVQIVILHNVPYQGEHEAIEVAARGSWHFFDPTSGIYMVQRGHDNVLGLPQARLIWHNITIMESTSPLFRGVWSSQRNFTYKPATSNIVTWHGHRAFDLHRTYISAPAFIRGPEDFS